MLEVFPQLIVLYLQKAFFLSIWTSEHVLGWSYSSTRNLLIVLIVLVCVEITFGADARQRKASVTSGKVFQTAHDLSSSHVLQMLKLCHKL